MYTYPSAVINHVTYTAVRWGQFPTIAYTTGGTAGSEVVTIAADLSAISIKISSGVSTNAQIAAAIAASTATVQSLMAKDLITVVIAGGHTTDTNTAVSPTSLTSAASVPAPVLPAVSMIVQVLVTDPVEPVEGQVWYNLTSHLLKYFDGTTVQTVDHV